MAGRPGPGTPGSGGRSAPGGSKEAAPGSGGGGAPGSRSEGPPDSPEAAAACFDGERSGPSARRIGVLAIQGDFEAHARALRRLGADPVEVRRPHELDQLDGLVVPGGESTTISKGLQAYGLEEPIRDFVRSGRPFFGTCAGLIVADRDHLGLIDIEARRNAFGRQLQSFEADVLVRGLGDEPLRAVFIRAPWIERAGPSVDPLAEIDGRLVVARERNMLVCAFHPELTDDLRLHALFMALAESAAGSPQSLGSKGRGLA